MRGTRLWLSIGLLALLASGLIAAGCGSGGDSSSTSGSGDTSASTGGDVTTISDGTLLIGTDAPYPPFEIGTPADANFSGFDVDVGNDVAEKLGLTPEFQDTSFDTIFRDVAANQFDIVVAASTITPGRQKTVNFSDPYYEAQQALVVPTGSDIATVDDLAGKIVSAQDGTTGETYGNDETDASEVRGFPEGPDAIAAVVTGQVDAAIIDEPVAVDAVDKQDGIEIATTIPTNELYGIAMSKENPALLDAVNQALQEMKDDGTIQSLYDKYLGGSQAPDSVLNGTTQNPG
ncbi:MAG: polar amino acid transport system substrate-binding protein [Solirubrobacterales bacterium]|jgi:polar amino acid transport system substrate-binding protein|nr:polar amino acid transport system substrate-binding protein [Solirubrobacterales bacterium]